MGVQLIFLDVRTSRIFDPKKSNHSNLRAIYDGIHLLFGFLFRIQSVRVTPIKPIPPIKRGCPVSKAQVVIPPIDTPPTATFSWSTPLLHLNVRSMD